MSVIYEVDGVELTSEEFERKYYLCRTCGKAEVNENVVNGRCAECHESGQIECVHCCEMIHADDCICAGNGDRMCDECFDDNYRICDDCERMENIDETFYIEGLDRCVCNRCYEYDYHACEECGRIEHCDDITWYRDRSYCEDCYGNRSSGIMSWDYTPDLTFYGDGNLFMGVEVEVDNGDDPDYLAERLRGDHPQIYFKEDGSLGCYGVEIVSHPMTLDYHLNEMRWKEVFSTSLGQGYRAHDTSTCGLHIHVSRNGFINEEDAILKLLYIQERFWDYIYTFSRRRETRYCSRIDEGFNNVKGKASRKKRAEELLHKTDSRYVALNLENSATVEFRVFKGTLKLSTFHATLQFVYQLVQLVNKVEFDELLDMEWNDITSHLTGTYEELDNYLKEKELLDVPEDPPAPDEEGSEVTVKIGDRVRVSSGDYLVGMEGIVRRIDGDFICIHFDTDVGGWADSALGIPEGHGCGIDISNLTVVPQLFQDFATRVDTSIPVDTPSNSWIVVAHNVDTPADATPVDTPVATHHVDTPADATPVDTPVATHHVDTPADATPVGIEVGDRVVCTSDVCGYCCNGQVGIVQEVGCATPLNILVNFETFEGGWFNENPAIPSSSSLYVDSHEVINLSKFNNYDFGENMGFTVGDRVRCKRTLLDFSTESNVGTIVTIGGCITVLFDKDVGGALEIDGLYKGRVVNVQSYDIEKVGATTIQEFDRVQYDFYPEGTEVTINIPRNARIGAVLSYSTLSRCYEVMTEHGIILVAKDDVTACRDFKEGDKIKVVNSDDTKISGEVGTVRRVDPISVMVYFDNDIGGFRDDMNGIPIGHGLHVGKNEIVKINNLITV